MSAVAVHHIGMACQDPIAVERWYTQYFGFRRGHVFDLGGGEQLVFTRSGNVYLEIFKTKEARPGPPPEKDGPWTPGWRHLAFIVDDVDAKLKEMGSDARITLGPLSFDAFIPGWKTVWVADPEGNIVEISQGYQDEAHPRPLEK